MSAPDSFEEFVLARQAALLRTAYLLTGHAQDAEDLVQTALIKVVPHWRRIADDPEPYVRRVLVRENISRWRRRRWREVASDALPEVLAEAPDHDDLLWVRSALAGLAPRQRAVVVLRYYEDRTESETRGPPGHLRGHGEVARPRRPDPAAIRPGPRVGRADLTLAARPVRASYGGLMLVAFSISPTSSDPTGSVTEAVAAAVRVVRESGLPHETTSMFTTVEGEWDEVMAVVKRAVDVVAEASPRVGLVLKADIRPGYDGQLTAKVERIEEALRGE